MDLEKMQAAVGAIIERLVDNERLRNSSSQPVLTVVEIEQILDQRKKKLIDELRSHGVAQLADAKPAPSKAPAPADPCAESRRAPA
jgi:hypothetical protein